MLSAQPSNIWAIRNATFTAVQLDNITPQNFYDETGAVIGSSIYSDNNGLIYNSNNNQALKGAFLQQNGYINAVVGGTNTPIQYAVVGTNNTAQVINTNGVVIYDPAIGNGWGQTNRAGTNGAELTEGQVSFNDISDTLNVEQNISDGSITTAKIGDNQITQQKLASNSVDSSKIIDGSIIDDDINATANIDGSKIRNVSIDANAKLKVWSVTGDQIAPMGFYDFTGSTDNTITAADTKVVTISNGSNQTITFNTPKLNHREIWFRGDATGAPTGVPSQDAVLTVKYGSLIKSEQIAWSFTEEFNHQVYYHVLMIIKEDGSDFSLIRIQNSYRGD